MRDVLAHQLCHNVLLNSGFDNMYEHISRLQSHSVTVTSQLARYCCCADADRRLEVRRSEQRLSDEAAARRRP